MPCENMISNVARLYRRIFHYFTRSAKLRACNGLLARLATSSSAMVVELGGCDHLWDEGEGCLVSLAL
jgi:hypothetical protein